ncbi:MAG: hypothetical protein ACYCYQ_13010 [Acidimicrobiales bacterium]
MSSGILCRLEEIVDGSGVASRIEALLPVGVRPRQLSVATLIVGVLLCLLDGRPAHLRRVHQALVSLDEAVRWRLGVLADWKGCPHLLTYRQIERTFSLVTDALDKDTSDGEPSEMLSDVVEALVEASISGAYKAITTSYAVDWSDQEAYSNPPKEPDGPCADPEASWGRRKSDAPGPKDELFFGYELQAATMVHEEAGPAVPELVRRITLTTCSVDPPPAFIPVLQRMAAQGVAIGDVLSDSGYAYRAAGHWALPLRAMGANIVTDLHPNDRGQKGTHAGATIYNGNLYCPSTPAALFELGPLSRQATADQIADHDALTTELARYKLGRITADDPDGFHRVACPAVMGKLRCPLRADSMALSHTRPEILDPPEHPPTCCSQQTVTVPVEVGSKTAQKHDYPSKAHRISYGRRTAVERTFSTTKDRASTDMTRGWCRLMGITGITLFVACGFVVRNLRIVDAFEARQADDARRLAAGLEPKTRRRRRKTIDNLVGASANAPP